MLFTISIYSMYSIPHWSSITAGEHFDLKFDVLEVGKLGKHQNLSEFDEDQIVMARCGKGDGAIILSSKHGSGAIKWSSKPESSGLGASLPATGGSSGAQATLSAYCCCVIHMLLACQESSVAQTQLWKGFLVTGPIWSHFDEPDFNLLWGQRPGCAHPPM